MKQVELRDVIETLSRDLMAILDEEIPPRRWPNDCGTAILAGSSCGKR